MLNTRGIVLVITIIHTTTIKTIIVIDTILSRKKPNRITGVASNAVPVVKATIIIMAAPMMANMIRSTRDTVQHKYDSNRQDSYQIRVANVKEDGPRSHDHHRDEVHGFPRCSKYRCVWHHVNAVGHEEWKEMVRRKKFGTDSADGTAWFE